MKKLITLLILLCFVVGAGTAPTYILAHYTMNDNALSTTVVDATGVYNGTFGDATGDPNTSAHDVTGIVNGALDFDGTDDFVGTADFQTLLRGSFSLSCWAYSADWSAGEGYVIGYRGLYGGLKHRANLEVFGNAIYFDCECGPDGIDRQLSGEVLVDGEWAFVAGTANAVTGVQRLYFNGNVVSSNATSVLGGMVSFNTGGAAMPIGAMRYESGLTGYFSGLIDNVMLFGKALSAYEVKVLYNAGHGTEIVADLDRIRRTPRRTRNKY